MRIGLFLKNLDEEYQIAIYRGVKAECAIQNIDLICVQSGISRHKRESETEFFPAREYIAADGVLLLPPALLEQADTALFRELPAVFSGTPLVSIGTYLPESPSIIIKCRRSMELLMEHLTGFHGYRKLLYIGGPVNHQDNILRENVFRIHVNTLRSSFPDVSGEVINGAFHETSGMLLLRNFISAHPADIPDAIVAANDYIATGALETLQAQSDKRWRNCPVTGFDDIDQARLEIPALTTIRQPLDKLGRLAVKTLTSMIQGRQIPKVIHVESELIIRHSCGCAEKCKPADDIKTPSSKGENARAERPPGPAQPERQLRNMSLLGQNFGSSNSIGELLSHLGFFLTNTGVNIFYLMVYPQPRKWIGGTGNLLYVRTGGQEHFSVENPRPIDTGKFFRRQINSDQDSGQKRSHAWCLNPLRLEKEYLGFILYEAPDGVHLQLCSAAILIANAVNRLRIMEDDKERARRLEEEVAFRTRDIAKAHRKLQEETKRRAEVEAEVLRISDLERLRFSLDLHDDICQRLAGISMFCKSLASGISPETFMPELSGLIDETLHLTRQYAHNSFPVELDSFGLKESLDALCGSIGKQGISCVYTWSVSGPAPLSRIQNINLYRIIQEALQNAVKHSKADRVEVQIRNEKGALIALVRDNGHGNPLLNGETPAYTGNKRREGLGLRSMRYRAHQLGAEYFFKSSEENGTMVEVRIPLQADSAEE
jgi:signal transduction histidine kinase/DNA-binding LacI/PurR family transcriptional regulator